MSDINQIKNNIKEELKEAKPSKTKILHNLYELRIKDEYKHLSDSEYLDILSEIYELSPKFFLKSIYPKISASKNPSFRSVKNKIIKHIMENVSLGSGDQILNNIKKELEKAPSTISKENILSFLFHEQLVSYSEFYNIVGETFKFNPEYYMKKLYGDVRKRILKLYGEEKLNEMEKYIIEKYCLYDGEQLLDVFYGNVRQIPKKKSQEVNILGRFYITNNRIISQGELFGMPYTGLYLPFLGQTGIVSAKKRERKERPIKNKIASSIQQEIPCYGYNISYKNLFNLKKKKNLEYQLKKENKTIVIKIRLPKENRAEHLDILYDILNKEQI